MNNSSAALVVIGGGPAGVFGALAFAEARPDLPVVLLEKAAVLLGKVKISGGGRCNVTHAQFDPARLVEYYPRGAQALRGPFTRFQPRDTVAWFTKRGVALKTEPDGRMFPQSDRSQTIIDCLSAELTRLKIEVRTHAAVSELERQADGFLLHLRSGEKLFAQRVLLAGGGDQAGFALARSLGHSIVPPVPSLFTFSIADARLNGLAGVSVETAALRLQAGKQQFEQSGPLLVTHWGISGPAVLRLSAWAARALAEVNYQAGLRINWLPAYNPESGFTLLQGIKAAAPRREMGLHHPGAALPARLWQRLVMAAEIDLRLPWGDCSNAALRRLSEELTAGKYQVQAKGEFKEEFVTCGGVALREVDFRSMQSRTAAGFYLAGEVLDIDGLTGGFNFQNAWTTGWIAGTAAAASFPGAVDNAQRAEYN